MEMDQQVKIVADIESGNTDTVSEDTGLPHFEVETREITLELHVSTSPLKSAPACSWFEHFIDKFKGVEGKKAPPMASVEHMITTSVLCFVGMLLVAVTSRWYLTINFKIDGIGVNLLTGAYAASAVLLYDAYQAPLTQPRCVMGSYIISSFIGVSVRIICELIGVGKWVTAPLAVAVSILAMNLTRTVHPPGGACALIAIIGGPSVINLGFWYILTSFGAAFIMLCVALIGNNLSPHRQYPQYW